MGSSGMKRRIRVSGDSILRSGRRLFASRNEEAVKRRKLTPVTVVNTQEKQKSEINLGESKNVYRNGTVEVMEIDHEERREIKENEDTIAEQDGEIKLGESKKSSSVDYNNVSRSKQFGIVYTRKRKRTIQGDSSIKFSSLEEKCNSDKRFKNKYFTKRFRTRLESGIFKSNLNSNRNDVLWKWPVIFFGPCSYNSSSISIYRFSCFVSSILRYMRKIKVYSSIGIRFSQDSTCTIRHGVLKLFGSVLSTPLFTVDFVSLPFCFMYIHSSLLLKFAFLSYALILHPVVENAMDDDIEVSSIVTRLHNFDKIVLPTKPVPGVKEISGYEQVEYVPFKLPELYISSRIDEVSRTLQKSYPIYDMDSVDEEWLMKFNHERFGGNEIVSEDTFEKVIDAFERGIYCSPDEYSDATSAVDRCLGLASKEVLEAVYRYWMTKRKKKRSPLVKVFQCYPRRRVRKHATITILRKKRSLRKRKSQLRTGKNVDFLEAMTNEQKTLEEAAKAYMKVQETQEDVRKSETAAIVKRQEAQALMKTADLATYRAIMALRIAEALSSTAGFLGDSDYVVL